MSEVDTSREAVNKAVGDVIIMSAGVSEGVRATVDPLLGIVRALLARAEAAEAERDGWMGAFDEVRAERDVLQRHLGEAIKAASEELGTAAEGAAIVKVLMDRALPAGHVAVRRSELLEWDDLLRCGRAEAIPVVRTNIAFELGATATQEAPK